MAIADDIRAMEAASMKRKGASLMEIAKFWNPDNPLTRQRISQLVKRGEMLMARRDNPLHLDIVDRDIIVTKQIALQLGLSSRVSSVLGRSNFTIRDIDQMLTSRRYILVNRPNFGIKTFNELADLFGRKRWENKYLGKSKYNSKSGKE